MQARIDAWIATTKRYDAEDKVVEFGMWAQALGYDIISELVFGKPIGFVAQERDVDSLLSAFTSAFPFFGIVVRLPWVVAHILDNPVLGPLVEPKPTDKTGLGRINCVRAPPRRAAPRAC